MVPTLVRSLGAHLPSRFLFRAHSLSLSLPSMASWADRIRKAAPVETPPEIGVQRVVAPSLSGASTNVVTIEQTSTDRVSLPTYAKGIVVLDANAFIKGLDNILDLADALLTVPQVVKEVKDQKAKELLQRLPVPLTLLDPTQQSIRDVMDMAKKTGDFGALSRTDIRIAALALDVAKQTESLRTEIAPSPAAINPDDTTHGVTIVDGANVEDQQEEEEEEEPEAEPDSDDDGCGEWITQTNLRQMQAKEDPGSVPFEGGFACISSDFPVQNTLLHLGVNVMGPQGMQITQLRTWLLRCHACFCLVHDTTRQFCPDCGSGNTLKRVSYEVLADGTKKLYINFKKTISKRGTVYSLPKPRGGRRGTNKTLALREDQLAHVQGKKATKEKRVEAMDSDAVFGEAKRARFDPNKPRFQSSYKKFNPNERKKQMAARKH